MQVSLISYPSMDADTLARMAAALCYDGKNPMRSLDTALAGGHQSVGHCRLHDLLQSADGPKGLCSCGKASHPLFRTGIYRTNQFEQQHYQPLVRE